MITAVFMPGVITGAAAPTFAAVRLIWIGLFTVLVGVTIPAIARKPTRKPREP
jgi:hypothetical protein